MAEKKQYKHPLAVRHKEENGLYTEHDEHGRVVFHEDNHGYFAFKFYVSEPHVVTPYMVLHKYFLLYNPNFKFAML